MEIKKLEHIAKLAVRELFAGDTEANVGQQNCTYIILCNKPLQLHMWPWYKLNIVKDMFPEEAIFGRD